MLTTNQTILAALARSQSADERLAVIDAAVLRGVSVELCLALARRVPPLTCPHEAAAFSVWLGMVGEAVEAAA